MAGSPKLKPSTKSIDTSKWLERGKLLLGSSLWHVGIVSLELFQNLFWFVGLQGDTGGKYVLFQERLSLTQITLNRLKNC